MTESKSATAKGKAGRPKKSETPEFDFSSLEFTEAEMPKPASTNPFVEGRSRSRYEYDTARAVTIPIEAGQSRATKGSSGARRTSWKIGVSASSRRRRATNEEGDPIPGMVDLVFKGKERRKRKRKGTDDAPAAGTRRPRRTPEPPNRPGTRELRNDPEKQRDSPRGRGNGECAGGCAVTAAARHTDGRRWTRERPPPAVRILGGRGAAVQMFGMNGEVRRPTCYVLVVPVDGRGGVRTV
jgi:hypothetical protein